MDTLIGIIALVFGAWWVWESTLILDERKTAYRNGLTDYYGNPLDDTDSE